MSWYRKIQDTYFCVDEAVLRACYEDETFDLEKIGEFGGVELADANCIAFFVVAG